MVQTVEALFDGTVLRPDTPLPLEANTRVRVTVETLPVEPPPPRSFLRTARSLKLEGPTDLDGKQFCMDGKVWTPSGGIRE